MFMFGHSYLFGRSGVELRPYTYLIGYHMPYGRCYTCCLYMPEEFFFSTVYKTRITEIARLISYYWPKILFHNAKDFLIVVGNVVEEVYRHRCASLT